MKTKLTRNNKDVTLLKKCPVCNRTRFKDVEDPIVKDGMMIIKKCQRCNYEYGVNL